MNDEILILRTFEEQKQFFEKFKKLFEIIKNGWPKLKIPKIPEAFEEQHETLLCAFRQPKIQAVCAQCRGECCHKLSFSPPMSLADLEYILAENPNYNLPEPDWNFLKQKNGIEKKDPVLPLYCFFVTCRGCLLGNYRPLECLCHFCDKITAVEKLQCQYRHMEQPLFDWSANLQKTNLKRINKNRYLKRIFEICPAYGINYLVSQFENTLKDA